MSEYVHRVVPNKEGHPRKRYEYAITHHARERYVEKLGPHRGHYKHLRECGKGCPKCHDLAWRMRDEVHANRGTLDRIMSARLFKATTLEIDRDSEFVEKLRSRYRNKEISFRHDGDAIFVIVHGDDYWGEYQKVCVTCYESNHSIFTGFIHRRVLIPLELLTEDLLEHVQKAEASFHSKNAG